MANKKKHLSEEERFCIEKMCKAGDSFGKIARTLMRGLSTISEEVNANGGRDTYTAKKAHHRAYLKQYRKKKECSKVALNSDLSRHVEKRLAAGQSPETIAARLKEEKRHEYASGKAIRTFIGYRPSLERFLFWKRTSMKSGRKRNGVSLSDPGRKFIDVRPGEVLSEYGHWEGDFIVSKHSASVLLVLVEKQTKTVRLTILSNRTNEYVNEAIVRLLTGFAVKSLTLDNDIAFTKWRDLETLLNTSIYFCHPYHSWEKGLVENTNRWIRQFIPKKTNIALLAESDMKDIEEWFNHTPRQCLKGRTAYEMMVEKEYHVLVRSLDINLPRLRIGG
jgi:IS30 family transposase